MEAQQPTARWEIPDAWASGRCPACGESALKVVHLPEYADYFSCQSCEISFEIATVGGQIRIKDVPERFEFADAVLYRRWLKASELRGVIEKERATRHKEEVVEQIAMTDEEVWSRALGMHRMGNPLWKIEPMLLRKGASQKQATGALKALKRKIEREQESQNTRVLAIAGVSVLILLIALAAWGVSSMKRAATTPTKVSNDTILKKLIDIAPKNLQPNLPDTTTRRAEVAAAKCPKTASEAAKVFGGDASLWTMSDQFMSWQLMSAIKSYTVRVPPDMNAAYIKNPSIEVKRADGPLIVYNVNFIIITCP
ncbi:MAG: hypothetical protein LC099_01315 [Anaerolineales bacterium]|nr:hypothetical protein [Anaerolineales bacterium]